MRLQAAGHKLCVPKFESIQPAKVSTRESKAAIDQPAKLRLTEREIQWGE
jgi:hypothetical protein